MISPPSERPGAFPGSPFPSSQLALPICHLRAASGISKGNRAVTHACFGKLRDQSKLNTSILSGGENDSRWKGNKMMRITDLCGEDQAISMVVTEPSNTQVRSRKASSCHG